MLSSRQRAQQCVEPLRVTRYRHPGFAFGEAGVEQLRPRQVVLLEMLCKLFETIIEIFAIDFHMLNASDRVDGQDLSSFHTCNLFHHFRTALKAAPLSENQKYILTLR